MAEVTANTNVAVVNSVKLYLREISQYDLLSKEEEVRLAEAAKNGDVEAKNELVKHNLRLVVSLAKHYMNRGLAFQDLIQEGNIGLITAVDKFDVSKGFKFSTYATYWIKQSISRAIMDKSRNIRIPIHTIELMSKIKKVERAFQQENGREPKEKEVAEILNLDIKKIKEAYSWMKDTTSLDIVVGDDEDATVGSFIEDNSVPFAFAEVEVGSRNEVIQTILNTLNDREKEVVMRRFGIGRERSETLEEIGVDLKLSRERIRQLEASALKKLRNPRRATILKKFI